MLCAVSMDNDCWCCRELEPWLGTYGAQPDEFLVGLAANSPGKFHGLLFRELDRILARTQPRKSVVFALDGPAPLAKLLTQRCAAVCSRVSLRQCRLGSRECSGQGVFKFGRGLCMQLLRVIARAPVASVGPADCTTALPLHWRATLLAQLLTPALHFCVSEATS